MQLRYLLRTNGKYLPSLRCYTAQASAAATKATCDGGATTPPSAKSKLKMSGWELHSYGEVEELQFSERLKVPPIRCSSECLVQVHSTTVNPIDVAMLGGYGATVLNAMRCQPGGIEFPLTLGREFCGVLAHRGMGVKSKLGIGQRVWGVVPLHMHGAHAEYVTVPEYCLSPTPSYLSNEEAASVLYAGLTAWSGLYITGRLGGICGVVTSAGGGANKRVLVLGGSGSVGSLAIQMLKSQGVQVLATCSENACELVKGIGADVVVDYNNPAEMETLYSYAPYDIVLDCAGQGADYAQKLKFQFQQYITFSSPLLRNIDNSGMGVGVMKNIADLVETNIKALSNQGGTVKWGFFAPAPQGIEYLKKVVERKKLLPIIDSVFKFQQMPEAFKKVQCGHLRGKVVVNLN